ncbi:MAG: PD-(D/E)XK nuclease family protein [Clostridia bacterium]|nr:PD-(D/E)XK nuclease family protein [Clostridia bacterium]
MLERAQEKLSADDPLRDKLHDLSLIASGYSLMLSGNYSDPSDDVTRLSDLLGKHDFFTSCDVYLDSFNGFTGAEFNVITRIISQADSLTVALCLPSPVPAAGFETVKATLNRLLSLCSDASVPSSAINGIRKERSEKYYSAAFLKLENAIRSFISPDVEAEPFTEAELASEEFPSPIRVYRPTDEFAEAELAATRIMQLIRGGARYRDIAVVGRGMDRFEGVLDTALTRFAIPFFMSVRRPVAAAPLFRVILHALAVLDGGWSAEDVMAYIKTGMTGLDTDAICDLEKYVTMWEISGRAWTTDQEWSMNPDGYTDTLTREGAEFLARINALRVTVRDPLIRLSESLADSANGRINLRAGCKAVYELLENTGIADRIRKSGTDEDVTLFNTVSDMLDMLVHVGGDLPVTPRVLSGILTMAAEKTDFGAIPETVDTVTVGDAALLRAGSVKHVIMLGCIDGVFPRAVADDSFFIDTEKERLEAIGINTSQKTDEMSDDELFYFYRAASSASLTLTLSCPMQDPEGKEYLPSAGFNAIKNLLIPNEKQSAPGYPDGIPLAERAFSTVNAAELYRAYAGTAEGESLMEAMLQSGITDASLATESISSPKAAVSKKTAAELFGGDIALTQYRLESYSLCPFKYYSNYVLKLGTQKKADFSSADIGNFIHRVLERAVAELFTPDGLKENVDQIDLDALLDDIIAEVVRGMMGRDAVCSARLSALIERLRRTSALLVRSLIDEFRESRFVPSFFELNIGDGGVPPFRVPLEDGTSIYVYGKIDRVDTYRHGGDVYVRVVDYKTGSRKHSLKKIEKGLDLQLLLYLFAIWRADRASLPDTLGFGGDGDGDVIPAGVIYQESTYPTVSSDKTPESTEAAISEGLKQLKRTGLLLNDPDVLEAMESEPGKFLPIKRNKDNVIVARSDSALRDLEEMGELADQISDILAQIGKSMRSGKAAAKPRLSEKPCEYCDFKAFCRSAKSDR